jgi:hypothetical protein
MLSDQQAAALIRALLSYAINGEQLETEDGMLKIAFSFMSQQIDRDAEKYKAKCYYHHKYLLGYLQFMLF